jgi:hypothetical protein
MSKVIEFFNLIPMKLLIGNILSLMKISWPTSRIRCLIHLQPTSHIQCLCHILLPNCMLEIMFLFLLQMMTMRMMRTVIWVDYVLHCIMMSQNCGCICTLVLYWNTLRCSMYWWGAYVVSLDPLWSVVACPFSPHFKIGIAFTTLVDFPLMLVTLHHVNHL